jgi:predicted transcriptional regulator
LLNKPYSTKKLATILNRSSARIYDVLHQLENEQKIKHFRVRSTDYWVLRSAEIVLLSKIKQEYLKHLEKPLKISQLAEIFSVCWKSANNRIKELEKLGLVAKHGRLWKSIKTSKQLIFL